MNRNLATIITGLTSVFGPWILSAAFGQTLPKSRIISNDSHHIYTELYSAESTRRTKDVVLYIPGQGDAISMYGYLGNTFINKYSRDVLMYDVRGQGQSSGARCHIDEYSDHLSDLKTVVHSLNEIYEGIHIIAHSTGALIASLFVLEKNATSAIKSLTLVSPFFGLAGPEVYRKFTGLTSVFGARTLGLQQTQILPFNPAVYVTSPERNLMTHDPEFFEKFNGHPEKCGTPTFGWIQASIAAQERLKLNSNRVSIPVLMLTAGDDGVVSTAEAKNRCEVWNNNNQLVCTYHEYPGMRHGLIYEIPAVREDLFNKIADMLARL